MPTMGVYRLTMKNGLDNYRVPFVQAIMKRVNAKDVPVAVYEPTLAESKFFGFEVTRDLAGFKERYDLIVANRRNDELADVAGKVYTRVFPEGLMGLYFS